MLGGCRFTVRTLPFVIRLLDGFIDKLMGEKVQRLRLPNPLVLRGSRSPHRHLLPLGPFRGPRPDRCTLLLRLKD